ncbi:polyprenyl synthetase family protein [Streptomyces sp. NPDC058257]|uniref:polyprenyl synthetase family protein n=1 Tax=Streptomyces sp. NPDC058257 TaxID=3346409 RepID=UPI0036E0679D
MPTPVAPLPLTPSGESLGLHLLESAQAATGPKMRAQCERMPSRMAGLAGYHLGWLDERGGPAQGSMGKAARPALALASTRAAGGSASDGLGPAVAVELVHNFSLVHDDVIDRDELRRHRRALWAVFGLPSALLSGDALLALALRVLSEPTGDPPGRAVSVLCDAVLELVEGEAMDVSFEQRTDVTVAEYTAMAAAKTGALMGCSCALGALAGGADIEQAELLRAFGRHLGVAFQIVDDLLGILGDADATGKPVGGDIAARKKTLPVLAALASSTPQARALARVYASDTHLTGAELRHAAGLVTEAGGVQAARRTVRRELSLAFEVLGEAAATPAGRRDLTALAHVLTQRDH